MQLQPLYADALLDNNDAVVIRIEQRARLENDAAKVESHADRACAVLATGTRIRPHCLYSQLQGIESHGVADAAVNDDPDPTVVEREIGDVVAEQRTATGTATIDHENSAVTRLFETLAKEDVVLKTTNRCDSSREGGSTE
jgi:hypothetical protein